MPEYPKSVINPAQSSDEAGDLNATGCFKLVHKEPYSGNNFSVIFKPKSSLNTLYRVITKMEVAKLNDNTVTFDFFYAMKKGNKIIMVVGMNIKALKIVSTLT